MDIKCPYCGSAANKVLPSYGANTFGLFGFDTDTSKFVPECALLLDAYYCPYCKYISTFAHETR